MDELPPPETPHPPSDRRRHPYHMHDMMRRQPIAARTTLTAVREASIPPVPTSGRVLFTGIGTSFHAAMALARAAQQETAEPLRRAVAIPAFELRNAPGALDGASLAVACSASGATDVTRRAVELCRAKGVPVLVLTATPNAPIPALAQHVLATQFADETSWTHTVSYTAALVAGHALLCRWAGDPAERVAELESVPDAITAALASETRLVDVADKFAERERWMLLGSGPRSVSVREGGLKLREGAGRFVTTLGVEEVLHGPLASLGEKDVLAAVTGTPLETARAEQAISAAQAIGAETLLFDSTPGTKGPGAWTDLPLAGSLSCLVDAIPFQLISYWIATSMGRNPDMMGLDDRRHLDARGKFGL